MCIRDRDRRWESILKRKGNSIKTRAKTGKRKSERYKIIFKKRTSIIKKRTSWETKEVFTRVKIRKTNWKI